MSGFAYTDLFKDYIKALRKQEPPLDPAKYGINSPVWGLVLSKLSDLWSLLLVMSTIPLFWLALDIGFDRLGSNPIEALHIRTGNWALRFLCITLLITPIQKVTRWRGLAHFRRLFGLLTFFYALIHVYGYVAVDHANQWDVIWTDLVETSYLWYGLFCFVVLTLLAATSFNAAQRLMGRNWKKLHRWIYPASIAAVMHYFTQLRGSLAEPLVYGLIIGLLLGFRIVIRWKERRLSRLMIPRRPVTLED
jgi:sulfoxide reductase heme-binding subunit YedZ